MKYWRFFKIYVMPLWQLKILDLFLTIVLAYYSSINVVKNLPYLMITPQGIKIDRRKRNTFHTPERRLLGLLRYRLHVFLYGFDDTDPTTP